MFFLLFFIQTKQFIKSVFFFRFYKKNSEFIPYNQQNLIKTAKTNFWTEIVPFNVSDCITKQEFMNFCDTVAEKILFVLVFLKENMQHKQEKVGVLHLK